MEEILTNNEAVLYLDRFKFKDDTRELTDIVSEILQLIPDATKGEYGETDLVVCANYCIRHLHNIDGVEEICKDSFHEDLLHDAILHTNHGGVI